MFVVTACRTGVSPLFVSWNYIVSFCLLNGTVLRVTFGTGRGGTKLTPDIVPFSVSVLALVTNRVDTAIWYLFLQGISSGRGHSVSRSYKVPPLITLPPVRYFSYT